MTQRREKREQREHEIIDKSIQLLSQQGFLSLRMSDIAQAAQYSMGTIYSHFESKEDLLIACAHTLVLEHQLLIQTIQQRPIPAIEQIIATAQCNWLISMHHPDLIEIDNLSLMPSVWRRATRQRADQLNQLHVVLASTFLAIVEQAIADNLHGYQHLEAAEKSQLAHTLTHGMWGLCVGLASTAQSGYASNLCPKNSDENHAHFTTNYANFLKGYGWQEPNIDTVFARCNTIAIECMKSTTWFSASEPAIQ
ncbi:MAG: TetR/AcrR family transcriptional regulator [Mariprofundales bacterium]